MSTHDIVWCKKDKKLSSKVKSITLIITPLRKHACLNILKILPPKKENFQIKNSDTFIFLVKTLIVGTHNLCF